MTIIRQTKINFSTVITMLLIPYREIHDIGENFEKPTEPKSLIILCHKVDCTNVCMQTIITFKPNEILYDK